MTTLTTGDVMKFVQENGLELTITVGRNGVEVCSSTVGTALFVRNSGSDCQTWCEGIKRK